MPARSYLRYEPRGMTGVIAANEGNVAALSCGGEGGKHAVICCPALENVHIFNAATLDIEGLLPGGNDEAAVSCLQVSPGDGAFLAVGYSDGHCSLYGTSDWTTVMQRGLGHKLSCRILCMALGAGGAALASGGTDCDIVWWDVPAQDPLFRLRGHKQAVVGLSLLESSVRPLLVSVGAEGIVRVWDPKLRACVHSFVGTETQATSMVIDAAEARLMIGARDEALRVWDMTAASRLEPEQEGVFVPHGSVTRQSHRPCAALRYNPSHTLLLVQAADKVIELFQVLSEKRVQAKMSRQRKRKREQGKEDEDVDRNAAVEFARLDAAIRTPVKIRSFCFIPQSATESRSEPERVVVHLNDNRFEVYSLTWGDDKDAPVTVERTRGCDVIGHRGEIRGSAMASTSRQVATCAVGGVKVWRIELEQEGEEGSIVDCTHTMPVLEPTCLTFLPGDQYIAAGTKEGTIELIDLRRSQVIESCEAHTGEVTSMCLRSDLRGIASGGKDKQLRTWTFEVQQDAETGGRRVGLAAAAALELTDAVTACTYSPDNKFLAVALQDSTVKVFFADSHKFFLSLYGHKYPVTALSISESSRMIATASIDKNVKIWGLDFGDCHKSIYAHDDYVTDIKWIPGTHHFWTTGKDGLVKAWDGDHFNLIQTLKGHHGAVWSLELSKEGGVLITCGADRSIRSWVRTEQQVFPEEEREREAQEAADKEAAATHAALDVPSHEVGIAGQRTSVHMRTSEGLMDCLDVVAAELDRMSEGGAAAAVQHPLLGTRTPLEALAAAVEGIKGHEMRYTLSGLPSVHCHRLLGYSVELLQQRLVRTESVAKVCMFVCRQHAAQIASDPELRATVMRLREALASALQAEVNLHGFNLAGLETLQHTLQEKAEGRSIFFDMSMKKGHKRQRT
eukprot:TRINITY_DN4520_c0_g1_i1.p1 TRINITY_DN4520_c0_g1~~TRINITY_DN4520_c0_g1_i1.p1  ORF type:complete len:905 (+),score=267.01 TRINITY_DN4520_c0_g1_i1:118-2832(+)